MALSAAGALCLPGGRGPSPLSTHPGGIGLFGNRNAVSKPAAPKGAVNRRGPEGEVPRIRQNLNAAASRGYTVTLAHYSLKTSIRS